jgi:hypothetical protein
MNKEERKPKKATVAVAAETEAAIQEEGVKREMMYKADRNKLTRKRENETVEEKDSTKIYLRICRKNNERNEKGREWNTKM